MDEWAPRWTAWDRDNVGLQIGNAGRSVRRILVTLDVTDSVVTEALARRVQLIVSHHPLLFRPLTSLTTADPIGRLALRLAENQVALFSAHTNLDAARDGVSFALARRLRLHNIRFLAPLRDMMAKIVVFVPHTHTSRVMEAMARAGAGVIGQYTDCAFVSSGYGSFRGNASTNPFIGKPGQLEHANESRLEMVAPRARVEEVVRAMKAAHPYEEVAYDVYDLRTPDVNTGMGAVGELARAETVRTFANRLKRTLGVRSLRVAGSIARRVKRVAVCGGSGSELIADAARAEVDVFVTADVRYHAFQHLPSAMMLMDAGHWETERVVLPVIAQKLKAMARQRRTSLSVFVTEQITNPVRSL